MDFIVGLPTSAAGYDSVLTVTNKLSKRIHLIPLKYGKAGGAEVARLFFDNMESAWSTKENSHRSRFEVHNTLLEYIEQTDGSSS